MQMSALFERLQQALGTRYTLRRELGTGGMGLVFLADDPSLRRPVAIKVLAPELATATTTERFIREARILARLSHPYIVPVHEVGEAGGLLFYVMDYLEGETLRERIARARMTPEETARTGRQLLDALALAHREGVIHRDIKPANVILADDRAILTDFGVARWGEDQDGEQSRTGERIGTPGYMTPEQLAGRPASPLTDLYALAMVLYEATTGRHWEVATTPARADWSGIPRWLQQALTRALEPAPADRWPDAAAFADALTRRVDRRPVIAAAGIIGLIGIIALVRLLWPPEPVAPAAEPSDLAILPFVEGDSAVLGRALARYTSLRLEWNPRWRLLPLRQSFAAWDAEQAGESGKVAALPARRAARGTILSRNDSLVLVVSIDSAGRTLDQVRVPGDPDPLVWARAISDSLVSRLFRPWAAEFHDLNRRSSLDPQAVRAVLAGNEAFQVDNMAVAAADYRRALQLDPGFAQAAWQLMLVRRWEREDFEDDLRRLYTEHQADLPPVYRELTRAQLEPDLRRRFAIYDSVIRRFPSHGVTVFITTDEMFHRGPLVGIPLRHAVDLMVDGSRRFADLDQASTYDHTVWGFLRLGERKAAAAELDRRDARTDNEAEAASRRRGSFLRLAYDARFHPWLAGFKRRLMDVSDDSTMRAEVARYVRLGVTMDIPDMEDQLGTLLTDDGRRPPIRAQGYVARSMALLMEGRVGDGLAMLDSAAFLMDTPEMRLQQAEWRIVPTTLGWPARPDDETRIAWATLANLADDSTLGPRAAWALAMATLHGSDTAAAAPWHAIVHAAAARGDPTAYRLDIIIHARQAALGGLPDSALHVTEPLFATDSSGRIGGPFARTAMYIGRGSWALTMGRRAAADSAWLWYENSDMVGWPEGPPQAGEVDGVFSTWARVLRVRNASAGGDTAGVCRMLHRVQELWRHADAPFRAIADSAQANSGCGR